LYTLNFCNTPYATPPAPPAPTIDLTSAPKSAGSVYAGTDSTGAAVYATPQTAQESQQAIKDNLATFYGGLDVPAPADCSGTFAFLNPVCPSTSALPWLIAGSVIAGMLLMGGRR